MQGKKHNTEKLVTEETTSGQEVLRDELQGGREGSELGLEEWIDFNSMQKWGWVGQWSFWTQGTTWPSGLEVGLAAP